MKHKEEEIIRQKQENKLYNKIKIRDKILKYKGKTIITAEKLAIKTKYNIFLQFFKIIFIYIFNIIFNYIYLFLILFRSIFYLLILIFKTKKVKIEKWQKI